MERGQSSLLDKLFQTSEDESARTWESLGTTSLLCPLAKMLTTQQEKMRKALVLHEPNVIGDLVTCSMSVHYFITGATGFVGGHLAEACVARGFTVSTIARPTSDTALLDRLGATVHRGEPTD